MGYEITFKFHDKKTEGAGYDVETTKTFKKVVGKATDDTPLELLAKLVFGQMARRDIWVVDADIFEYTKKKISFKNTDGGVLLKNKKFSFDLTCENVELPVSAESSDDAFTNSVEYEEVAPVPKQKKLVVVPPAPKKETVLRYEVYDPHPDIAAVAKRRNMAFTIGKRYPIYSETPDGRNILLGMNYLTEDDNGNRRTMNDKHFTPVVSTLENGFEPEFKPAQERAVLSHQNKFDDSMPAVHTFGRR
jgi:hypothetical protein